ncbi:hypothetical protein A6V36_31550 [Paraburkholderia ginsengiterrae]|uniref:Uncharacterized protein n=1 Tax=Paraburkholderia ginsengiterrae TaxID=1462993 RepID=A0A1A9N5Z9_9BURK|nr:hypothetical protein [Paraburkholderia ginsengiterrae]OAJ57358.1 hypothetical protein A6V36_31550 [Paraburkholderia ginsengiterrae]OAJ58959.1 hypothetical protein A6V37_28150 [Paraburkholderia ginsengiterrae]
MKFDFHETIARLVLMFLLGIALSVILKRLDWPSTFWKDVLSGGGSFVLTDVFFNFSSNQKKQ